MYNESTAATDGKKQQRNILTRIVEQSAKEGVKEFGSIALSFRCDGEKKIIRAAKANGIKPFGYCVEGKSRYVYGEMSRLCPVNYIPVWGDIAATHNILTYVKKDHLEKIRLVWLDFCGSPVCGESMPILSISEWLSVLPSSNFNPYIIVTFSLNPQGISKSTVWSRLAAIAFQDRRSRSSLEHMLTLAIANHHITGSPKYGFNFESINLYKGGVRSNMYMAVLRRNNSGVVTMEGAEWNDIRPPDYIHATTHKGIFENASTPVTSIRVKSPVMVEAGKKAWATRKANAAKKMLKAA